MEGGNNGGVSIGGNAVGSVITGGTGNQVTVAGQPPVSFGDVNDMLRARSTTARDFQELYDAVRGIEREVARGPQADPGIVRRCLGVLGTRAPEILAAVLAILTSQPVTASIRNLAAGWP